MQKDADLSGCKEGLNGKLCGLTLRPIFTTLIRPIQLQNVPLRDRVIPLLYRRLSPCSHRITMHPLAEIHLSAEVSPGRRRRAFPGQYLGREKPNMTTVLVVGAY